MRFGYLFFIWLLWFLAVFFTPSTVYWRDSGEFIIQAFALDISHPAGFPTYGMLANTFALLPFGVIPWRVILLSGVSFVTICFLVHTVIAQLLPQQNSLTHARASTIVILFSLLLLPAIIKQILSAEVYVLNAALLVLIMSLLIKGVHTNDFRSLATAAFIGALALGNHVSVLFSALPLILLIVVITPRARRSWLILTFFTLAGLTVYSYLPLRAERPLPLNTGAPTSIERLWNVLSDARDRALRPGTVETGALKGFEKLIPNPLTNFAHDAAVLSGTRPTVFVATLIAVILGGIVLRWRETCVLFFIGLGNYLFFAGWDGDPWIPAVISFALLAMMLGVLLLERLRLHRFISSLLLVPLIALLILFPTQETVAQLFYLRNYSTPALSAEAWLQSSNAPVVVSENSWFLLRYLSDIEGVEDQRSIIYQPALLFPHYFAPVKIKLPSGEQFDSLSDAITSGESAFAPSFGTLGRFIERVSFHNPIQIEPSAPINSALAAIINFNKNGSTEITRGIYDSTNEHLSTLITKRFAAIAQEGQTAPGFIRVDAQNYFENVLNSEIDLMRKQKKSSEAINLLKMLCLPMESQHCSLVSLNHLGLIYLENANFIAATDLYLALIRYNPQNYQVIFKNAQRAVRGLSTEQHLALPQQELVQELLRQ